MKKLLFSLVVICLFNACKDNHTKKTEQCIDEILSLEANDSICILYLNPKTSCWACYYGAINNAAKLSSKYNIKIITTSDIAQSFKGSVLHITIDDDNRLSKIYPAETMNSKIFLLKDKEIFYAKNFDNSNIDSLEIFIEREYANNR